jgi:aspartate/methionine/tyrosine aminotransferase
MSNRDRRYQAIFALKSLRAAKVSEISEATAGAAVAPEQRVNFHIGHPVQDDRLTRLYQTLIFGLPVNSDRRVSDPLESLTVDENLMARLRFLAQTVENSVAYLPSGGFSSRSPGPLAERLQHWLGPGQEESLDYDLGLKSGRRELTMISGGRWEAIRMLFAMLNKYLERQPAKIYLYQIELPSPIAEISGSWIQPISHNETQALLSLEEELQTAPENPHFLLLGAVMTEDARRKLRSLCLDAPLFLVEVNNAPNHNSLGREAGLAERVLRILTPEAIDPHLWPVSLAFLVGNSDFVQAIETTHFELKGTPSAPEVDLCAFLMKTLEGSGSRLDPVYPTDFHQEEPGLTATYGPIRFMGGSNRLEQVAQSMENLAERVEHVISQGANSLLRIADQVDDWVTRLPALRWAMDDPFAGMSALEVIERFFDNNKDSRWHRKLQQALLASFLNHHPEYDCQACTVISGSARTAFGILGRHCGIRDVVTPDLSWTYEHGFDNVTAVPLTEKLDLDDQAIIDTISLKLQRDPNWRTYGAVVINNPHNASGAVFHQDVVTRLVRWLLERGIWVIDDLSYEDVLPGEHLQDYDTIRRIVSRLVRTGSLRREQANRVITVHSLSKTDCLAGARLAIAEILDSEIRDGFRAVANTIQPNLTAYLMVYLFYRRQANDVQQFWLLRNQVMAERMDALKAAVNELPDERNPYDIQVEAPEGSMYPRLVIERLPVGVSLDWLASGLAPRGIGLLPFSTFARTARGFDLARKSFRLTLGGQDGPFLLQRKTRRVMIDLNRLIEDQEKLYSIQKVPSIRISGRKGESSQMAERYWPRTQAHLVEKSILNFSSMIQKYADRLDPQREEQFFTQDYLPERMDVIRQRLFDRTALADLIIEHSHIRGGDPILYNLERELQPVSLPEKQDAFKSRLFDRTVHPTQMYSLAVDMNVDHLVRDSLLYEKVEPQTLDTLARHLAAEYLGNNVAICSDEEAEELVVDLSALVDAEAWAEFNHQCSLPTLLSFWGDWDGSTRPSGQGHRLVAGALLANVTELSHIFRVLNLSRFDIQLDSDLEEDVSHLEIGNKQFWTLLNEITDLTGQLEKRYLRVLPFDVSPGFWRRIGMRLHLARDPISLLWQHNDRLERRMLKMREQRRESLEYYLQLNQRIQHYLRENLDTIRPLLDDPRIAIRLGFYRNIMKRFVLTPRIHQRMVLSRDQFAIDTTVHNLVEINRLAGQYGVPGLVLALQVSMSTDPEALIALDRKLGQERREVLRHMEAFPLPNIWVVPLFENLDTIRSLESYLDRVWEYAVQSRRLGQDSGERFQEILCEVFFAGSDLSQEVGQPGGEAVYRQAKYELVKWLSNHNLTHGVRIKLGSGEPAQRQGGYYDPRGTLQPVLTTRSAQRIMQAHLGDAERRAWELARTPLRGVQAGGEFRTFQSNLFEQLRWLSAEERTGLLYHIWQSQTKYEKELERAASALEDTRLHFEEHSLQELETLTMGSRVPSYQEFLELAKDNFRQILYGREEDVVGIHIISHFISRAIPSLRDRPVVRPSREDGDGQEIVGRLARILPLSQHGSMLRAIGHNRAQTMILGVNQFTSGLFRALNDFWESRESGSDQMRSLEDYVLPKLNVYDMLHSLRVYHDPQLEYVRKMELRFPAGNTAFVALREDNDLIPYYIPYLQRELLRRSGMDVEGAIMDGHVKTELLPTLRPDLAVLLQRDLFNTDLNNMLDIMGGDDDPLWLDSVEALLHLPEQVHEWRARIWAIIEDPIQTQVESFVALALAIHSLRVGSSRSAEPLVAEPAEVQRLGAQVAELLRGVADDPLRQFLVASVQYLTELPGTLTDVPVDVMRALRDVERIVKIEEQALGPDQQAWVQFYVLKIARLCGENG